MPTYESSPEAVAVEAENGPYVNIVHFVAHLLRLREVGDTDRFTQVFGRDRVDPARRRHRRARPCHRRFLDDLAGDGVPDEYRGSVVWFTPWLGPKTRADLASAPRSRIAPTTTKPEQRSSATVLADDARASDPLDPTGTVLARRAPDYRPPGVPTAQFRVGRRSRGTRRPPG